MFCSGWLARANAGNSNPSMQRNDAALFSRVKETKRTQHVQTRSHVGSVGQRTTCCREGRFWQAEFLSFFYS